MVSLKEMFDIGVHSSVVKSLEFLSKITHSKVELFYHKAGI